MKVVIDRDEYYPYYSICKDGMYLFDINQIVDIPDELVKEAEEIEKRARDVQVKLEEYWKRSKKA